MPMREKSQESDLRHLNRRDLLELLEELSAENDRLHEELDEANAKLASRDLELSRCGTLAEASLALSGIFEAADRAARTYVDSVRQAADAGRLDLEGPGPDAAPMPARKDREEREEAPSPKRGKHGKKHKGKK